MTPEQQGRYTISFGLHREKGPVRQENQDQILHFQSSVYGHVFIVADGMGGHEGGAIAANMAITGFKQHFLNVSLRLPLRESISEAARLTNLDIFEKSNESGDGANQLRMGSTLVLCVIAGNSYTVANVGDSRCYSFRNGELRKRTKDHTAVQKMIDSGILSSEEARNHPEASVLTRAFGQRSEIEIDIYEPAAIAPDECLLLCSDGLYGYVDEALIVDRLQKYPDPQAAADALLQLALDAGGHDNISIFLIRVGPPGVTTGIAKADTAPDPPEIELPAPVPAVASSGKSAAQAAPPATAETRSRSGPWFLALFALILAVAASAALAFMRPDLIPGTVRDRLVAWGVRDWGVPIAKDTDTAAPGPPAASAPVKTPAPTPDAPKPPGTPSLPDSSATAPKVDPALKSPTPESTAARLPANVYIVYPHTGNQVFVQGIAAFRDKLTASGFKSRLSEKPIQTASAVWRLVVPDPAGFAPAQALVSAVFLPGYKNDAIEVCRIVGGCTEPMPKLIVGAPDRRIVESEFAGGTVILFTHPPVVVPNPMPAAGIPPPAVQ